MVTNSFGQTVPGGMPVVSATFPAGQGVVSVSATLM
jgi:hypothetical protein